MKAYVVENTKKIDPFDEYPRDCLIVNKPLTILQKEVLERAGLTSVFFSKGCINDPDEYIFFPDTLYFTQELLKEFITRSRKEKSSTTCALKPGITTLRTITATQEVRVSSNYIEYGLHYFPEKKFRGDSQPLIIDAAQGYANIPIPRHICSNGEYLIPMTEKFILQINHWVNLWAANIGTLLGKVARLQKMPKIKWAFLVQKACSLNKWKILAQTNRIGRNCDIHPTAYIEGSTIGDNVRIGAGAIIRESTIGSNSFIGNGVVIEESVIGEKSTILSGHILYSVLYPGTFSVAQFISASLIGRDTFMGANVVLTDFRLDGENVTVMKDGIKIDTQNKFLGSCLGHGVYLGSGCVVAPGRTIPQNMRVTPGKDRVISVCDFNQEILGFQVIERKTPCS